MTALNWVLDDHHIAIQCDTLVTVNDGGENYPAFTTTKIYPAPHIKSVLSGTGIQRVTTDWFTKMCSSLVIKDVEMLNDYTPRHLREIYGNLAKEGAVGTATVYQFGWSEDKQKFLGFAYRSESHFESEPLEIGIAMKPAIDNPDSYFGADPLPPLETLMDIQQCEDRSKPLTDRIGIGGDKLQYVAFIDSETGFFTSQFSQIGSFENTELDWQMIAANLPNNTQSLFSKAARNNYEQASMTKPTPKP